MDIGQKVRNSGSVPSGRL